MAEIDTFGITLPVSDWRRLFELARRADRAPSDYLRTMIRQEAQRRIPVQYAKRVVGRKVYGGQSTSLPLRVNTAVSEGGTCVDVLIQDTGQGIPEADKSRIFQSFFTTKIKGTGLGLTIVQRVLKNHGGEIFIERPDGGGTRVLVRLPASGT